MVFIILFLAIAVLYFLVFSQLIDITDIKRDVNGAYCGMGDLRKRHGDLRRKYEEHHEANRNSHLFFEQTIAEVANLISVLGIQLDKTIHLIDRKADEAKANTDMAVAGLGDHLGLEWKDASTSFAETDGEDGQKVMTGTYTPAGWHSKEQQLEAPKRRRRAFKAIPEPEAA